MATSYQGTWRWRLFLSNFSPPPSSLSENIWVELSQWPCVHKSQVANCIIRFIPPVAWTKWNKIQEQKCLCYWLVIFIYFIYFLLWRSWCQRSYVYFIYFIYFIYFSGDHQCTKFTWLARQTRWLIFSDDIQTCCSIRTTPRLDPCPGCHTSFPFLILIFPMQYLGTHLDLLRVSTQRLIWTLKTTSFQSDVGGG